MISEISVFALKVINISYFNPIDKVKESAILGNLDDNKGAYLLEMKAINYY